MWVQCSHIGLTCRRSCHSEGSTWSLMLCACSLEIHTVLPNSCFVSQVQWGRAAGMGSGPQLTWSRLLPAASSPTPGAPGPTQPPTLCSQRGVSMGRGRVPRSISGQGMAAAASQCLSPLLGWQPHSMAGGQPVRGLILAGAIQAPRSRYKESPSLEV